MANLKAYGLTKPTLGTCLMCAVEHGPFQPHVMNLVYENMFLTMHDRWPTMEDSAAHCMPKFREKWLESMKEAMGEARVCNPIHSGGSQTAFR